MNNITVSLEELSIKVNLLLERDIISSNSVIYALIKSTELDSKTIAIFEEKLRWKHCPYIHKELIKQKNITAETIYNIVETHIRDSEGIMDLAVKKEQTNNDTLRLILYRTISPATFTTALKHKNTLPKDIADQMYNTEYAFKANIAMRYFKSSHTSAKVIRDIAKYVVCDWGCEPILLEIAKHPNTDVETLHWLATNNEVINCFSSCDLLPKLKDAIVNNPKATSDILAELRKF